MGLDVIAGWLEAAGVPPGAVVVGDAAAPDAVWRIRALTTEEGPGWEVFWSQDGSRRAWVRFDDEATACFALLGRLMWVRLARGPR